jgi:hypothetical protein
VSVGRVPVSGAQGPLNRVAPEPRMIVADGAFRQQGLACGNRSLQTCWAWLHDGQQSEENRSTNPGLAPKLISHPIRTPNDEWLRVVAVNAITNYRRVHFNRQRTS